MSVEQLLLIFRSNVTAVRNKAGLSQSELARRIGRTPGYVCDLERGRRAPNLTTVALIAAGLGVLPSILVSSRLPKKYR